jgi:hypothetical protein
MTARSSVGSRFVGSAQYRSAYESGVFKDGSVQPFPDDMSGVELLDTREIVRALRLRTYADLSSFDIEGTPYVGEAPKAAHLPQAVETIPTEKLQVELANESSEGQFAAGVLDGQPYVEAVLTFTGAEGGSATAPTQQKLPRFGISAPVTLSELDEPGTVESLINRRISASIGLGLEAEMLNGGLTVGSGGSLITQAAAPGSPVAKGSSYRAFAIRNAVADVQNAGWYERPLQVVINPTTAASLFEEEDGSSRPLAILDMFDDSVDAWIVSKAMPAGEALVGDFFNGVALFVNGPLTVGFSRNHLDFLKRSMAMMTIGFRAFTWVRQPSALCLVTGIS